MQRLDMASVVPEAYKAVMHLEKHVRSTVDGTVLELVKLRASILNGWAHSRSSHIVRQDVQACLPVRPGTRRTSTR
ncbi:hypothetical protein Ga0074812_101102 [Parafrankia irregularis]|uniref:Uncharacterized protein n=1 Tax=Parafrankia irregularis TaxID=795642 RepID=A0A0S4QDP0_9ACTN|nr:MULTISPECIES: hypothetical protein [Parafrankia]CUU53604.1 hypothetical protein Ga0074812_101102 [Parafrankia irregularis]